MQEGGVSGQVGAHRAQLEELRQVEQDRVENHRHNKVTRRVLVPGNTDLSLSLFLSLSHLYFMNG